MGGTRPRRPVKKQSVDEAPVAGRLRGLRRLHLKVKGQCVDRYPLLSRIVLSQEGKG